MSVFIIWILEFEICFSKGIPSGEICVFEYWYLP
jgi:hypothetical protein